MSKEGIDVTEGSRPCPSVKQRRLFPIRVVGVLALAAVLFFARLGGRALWSEEVRWAEIPREMRLNADYLWPTINGHTYYAKPLGSYWLVLLASWAEGDIDETAARLPCACSGLLGVLLVMLVTRRLFDERTAILAGIILATSFSFVFFSRTASTDVETVTGVLAALWLFLRNEHKPQGWWTVWLWLIMALTSLTKGLLGFVLPVLVIGAYSTFTAPPLASAPSSLHPLRAWLAALRSRNLWLFNRQSLLAIPLGLLIYLLPFLLSYAVTRSPEGLEMVYRENVRRYVDPIDHRGPIYLYAGSIFLLMAPWSLLLPAALVQAHSRPVRGPRSRGERFALVYFWGLFLFFTVCSSRRSYYLLPILPAGAILVARLLAARGEPLKRLARSLLIAGYVLIGLGSLASIVAIVPARMLPAPWDRLPGFPHPWLFVLLWFACALGIHAARALRPKQVAVSMSLIASSFMVYLFLVAVPAVEACRTQKRFAEEVREQLGPQVGKLALFHHRGIVFYLGQPNPIPECDTAQDLARGVREGNVGWVILPRRDWSTSGLGGKVVLAEKSWPGEPPAEGKRKLLLLDVRRERGDREKRPRP